MAGRLHSAASEAFHSEEAGNRGEPVNPLWRTEEKGELFFEESTINRPPTGRKDRLWQRNFRPRRLPFGIQKGHSAFLSSRLVTWGCSGAEDKRFSGNHGRSRDLVTRLSAHSAQCRGYDAWGAGNRCHATHEIEVPVAFRAPSNEADA